VIISLPFSPWVERTGLEKRATRANPTQHSKRLQLLNPANDKKVNSQNRLFQETLIAATAHIAAR